MSAPGASGWATALNYSQCPRCGVFYDTSLNSGAHFCGAEGQPQQWKPLPAGGGFELQPVNPGFVSWPPVSAPVGWRCPGCARCFSPHMPQCFFCQPLEPAKSEAPKVAP